jgi:TolA-binding protein
MDSLDDLLIKRRRGTLVEADAQRLGSALRSSREYELALLAGDAFDRDGSAQPGDEQRLAQLVAGVERGWRVAPPRRRWLGRVRPLVAVPLFFAGAAAASYGAYRAVDGIARGALHANTALPPTALARATRTPPSLSPGQPALAPPANLGDTPAAAPAPQRAAALASAGGAAASGVLSAATQRPPRAPRGNAVRERAAATPLGQTPMDTPADDPSDAARALFRRANRLRQGDWSQAAATYGELIERYPSSAEAGVAEVALGKWYLGQGRSGDALEQFRAHRRRTGSALAAEALWGEAQALESLGSRAGAREPWQRLLDHFPESPYATVARERLAR